MKRNSVQINSTLTRPNLKRHSSQKMISSYTKRNDNSFIPVQQHKSSNTKQPYIPKSHSIKTPLIKYSQFQSQNSNYKHTMEDVILIQSPFNDKDNKHHLFGVFDGNGGILSAEISEKKFPQIFTQFLKENPINIEACFNKAFLFLDYETYINQCHDIGNTATIVYIAGKMIYCANVGDSKCVLIVSDKIVSITTLDRADNESEKKRAEAAGGIFIGKILNEELLITRSIGNHNHKEKGLINTPHVSKYLLTPDVSYCIIATDGVWDFVSGEELLATIKKCKGNEKTIVKELVDIAKMNGSKDNLSCIVIKFISGN